MLLQLPNTVAPPCHFNALGHHLRPALCNGAQADLAASRAAHEVRPRVVPCTGAVCNHAGTPPLTGVCVPSHPSPISERVLHALTASYRCMCNLQATKTNLAKMGRTAQQLQKRADEAEKDLEVVGERYSEAVSRATRSALPFLQTKRLTGHISR